MLLLSLPCDWTGRMPCWPLLWPGDHHDHRRTGVWWVNPVIWRHTDSRSLNRCRDAYLYRSLLGAIKHEFTRILWCYFSKSMKVVTGDLKGKGIVLYGLVYNPSNRSKALHFIICKPVHTDTQSTYLGNVNPRYNYCAKIFTHISITAYIQGLIYMAEWTGASWRERKWPSIETATTIESPAHSAADLPRCRIPLSYPGIPICNRDNLKNSQRVVGNVRFSICRNITFDIHTFIVAVDRPAYVKWKQFGWMRFWLIVPNTRSRSIQAWN